MKIILASNSPRRLELLKLLKIPFEVASPRYEEIPVVHRAPEEEALLFARQKALSIKESFPDALIIGCDTIVECQGQKFGKPRDAAQALSMLQVLAGRRHRVLTGISVLHMPTGRSRECLGQTWVTLKPFDEFEAREYIATGEPLGKAGAYAIQGKGAALVEKIEGDYFNVVGLPLRQTADLLAAWGIEIPVDLEKIYRESPF